MINVDISKYDGETCPNCQAKGDEFVVVGTCGDTWQDVSCSRCEAQWTERYRLYEVVLFPKEDDK